MTNEELIELARRAVACKGWRWMPGMLTEAGRLVATQNGEDWLVADPLANCSVYRGAWLDAPDLSDPATIGCVWALLSEQAGWYWIAYRDAKWSMYHWMGGFTPKVEITRGHNRDALAMQALVAALEAAGQGGEP